MKKLYFTVILFCLLVLTGCNGHNDEDGDKSPQIATSIILRIVDSQGSEKQSFDKNESITLQATVYDEKNVVITNKMVSFSSTLGLLAVSSKLTDTNGIASVFLTNESLAIGAGSISANVGEVNSPEVEFEFIDNKAPITLPNISTTMMLNGEVANQFKANQEVQIISTLTDNNGQAIANQLITFTADIGILNTTTALTNGQGIANVNLTSSNDIIGAGVMTSSYTINDEENTNITSALNYQILAADAIIDSDIRLGHFDQDMNFIEGKIALSIADKTLSAGGTLGLSVDLIDESGELIIPPVPVTFTSNCVQNGNATIDESVLSINGTASSTFEDINCAGTTGTDDILLASVAVNGITNTASETITINGEQLGSIEFISSEPSTIVLKGTGGQNQQETSTLTFKVKSQLGNILAQQEVNFTLSTTVGGITLSRESGLTNSQGLISTQVSAGTVPTAVRVTAKATMDFNGEAIQVQTQSDLLSINTGLPEQRSMTIAASVLNPEAHNRADEESSITVWLADNFNNPVPDGTTVNFTTEGGHIEPSCNTIHGSCVVIWNSAEPRVTDHRITILATALGHETFFDTNGNNIFDNADGEAIIDNGGANGFTIDSGLDNYPAQASGFFDMSEAWRDDNENSQYDAGEKFIDFNDDSTFSTANSLFNGPQCQGERCANESAIHVRKAIRLVMASSAAEYSLTNAPIVGDNTIIYENSITGLSTAIEPIIDGSSQTFIFNVADTGTPNQTLPKDTTVEISLSTGELQGNTNYTVGNNNHEGFHSMTFFIVNEAGGNAGIATLTFTITTPKDFVTSFSRQIELL
ncbi:MAG: Ig-like domain-containing protein [Colwellia sp.]